MTKIIIIGNETIKCKSESDQNWTGTVINIEIG